MGLEDMFILFPSRSVTPAGEGGYYFDIAVSRWVPVPRNAVAPDGRRYAYTEGWAANPGKAPQLHIVNAATLTDLRVITMPDTNPYVVADFTAEGVYASVLYEGTARTWRIDPNTGAVAKVSDEYYVPAGPTWIAVLDPKDPNPARSAESGQPLPDRIDRRASTGAITTWFYKPGFAVRWSGFAGRSQVLVMASSGSLDAPVTELWLVTGPGHAVRLISFTDTSPYAEIISGFLDSIADAHGIWIGGFNGLFLVTPSGSIELVYAQPAYPANGCF